jgi:hypothetical protein
MTNIRLSLPTVLVLLAVVGAGAFAAGQSTSSGSSSPSSLSNALPPGNPTPVPIAETEDPTESQEMLPPGHPPTTGAAAEQLPAGHPPLDSVERAGPKPATAGGPSDSAPFDWKAPARWQLVPNANAMRIATYRIPRAPGDGEDAELSVVQAGGSVDANAERWIGQFDSASQKTAKRSTRKIGALEVAIVEAQGNYSGGMGKEAAARSGWALLGAIAPTSSLPCFFKLTGPVKTVAAARSEFNALVASLVPR